LQKPIDNIPLRYYTIIKIPKWDVRRGLVFPNLEAEQARKGHINAQVAEKLNMSRRLYEIKKKNGTFKFNEIQKLLEMYDCNFEYLFSSEPAPAQSA